MNNDPFGNLTNSNSALSTVKDLANNGNLSQCQPGLVRILRHKGSWRLREEVLERLGEIKTPSNELLDQLITILDDDNIYYDARIMAGNALIQLFKNAGDQIDDDTHGATQKVIKKLKSMPQPPFFDKALDRFHLELDL